MLGQIGFYQVSIYNFEIYGFYAILAFGLPLLGAPILFLYVLWLTGGKICWKNSSLHMSFYVIYVFVFYLLTERNSISVVAKNGYLKIEGASLHLAQYYAIPLAISGLVYCIWDVMLLRRHRKSINNLFSFKENIDLNWVRYIVYCYFLLFILSSIFIFGASQFQLLPLTDAFTLVGISLSVMLLAFAFYGFRQTAVFSNIGLPNYRDDTITKPEKGKSLYSNSGLSLDKVQNLANQLEAYMVKERPFLSENLNLAMLAKQIEISPSHLSQVINQHFEKNFYDFVNQYRVDFAKGMLSSKDYSHLSILGIAFDCGFKSKSSFNRYFKKYTGAAPSQFQNKISQ